MPRQSSVQTATALIRVSAARRASLRGLTTSLLTRMSDTPPQARISASATFCTHWPTAPRAICRCATTGDLWVLAWGRSFTPAFGGHVGHRVEVELESFEVDDQRPACRSPSIGIPGSAGRALQHRIRPRARRDVALNRSKFVTDIACGPERQRRDRRRGIDDAARGQDAAVHDEEVRARPNSGSTC